MLAAIPAMTFITVPVVNAETYIPGEVLFRDIFKETAASWTPDGFTGTVAYTNMLAPGELPTVEVTAGVFRPNANTLVDTSWINSSIYGIVKNNDKTDFFNGKGKLFEEELSSVDASGNPILDGDGQPTTYMRTVSGRQTKTAETSRIAYNLNFPIETTFNLNVVGFNSVYNIFAQKLGANPGTSVWNYQPNWWAANVHFDSKYQTNLEESAETEGAVGATYDFSSKPEIVADISNTFTNDPVVTYNADEDIMLYLNQKLGFGTGMSNIYQTQIMKMYSIQAPATYNQGTTTMRVRGTNIPGETDVSTTAKGIPSKGDIEIPSNPVWLTGTKSATYEFQIQDAGGGAWTTIPYTYKTVGVCGQDWLTDWQLGNLEVTVPANKNLRVTIIAPSMYSSDTAGQLADTTTGKSAWMNNGIWLQKATFSVPETAGSGSTGGYKYEPVVDTFSTRLPDATYTNIGTSTALVSASWYNSNGMNDPLAKAYYVQNNNATDFQKYIRSADSTGAKKYNDDRLFNSIGMRYVNPDETGSVYYDFMYSQDVDVYLNAVGRMNLFGYMVKTDRWYGKAKWEVLGGTSGYLASNPPISTPAIVNMTNSYKFADEGISSAAPAKMYAKADPSKNNHLVKYLLDPDGNVQIMNDYFGTEPVAGTPESLGLTPVFKFEYTTDDGATWKALNYNIVTVANATGYASVNPDDNQQSALLKVTLPKKSKLRVSVTNPTILGSQTATEYNADQYGLPVWRGTPLAVQSVFFDYDVTKDGLIRENFNYDFSTQHDNVTTDNIKESTALVGADWLGGALKPILQAQPPLITTQYLVQTGDKFDFANLFGNVNSIFSPGQNRHINPDEKGVFTHNAGFGDITQVFVSAAGRLNLFGIMGKEDGKDWEYISNYSVDAYAYMAALEEAAIKKIPLVIALEDILGEYDYDDVQLCHMFVKKNTEKDNHFERYIKDPDGNFWLCDGVMTFNDEDKARKFDGTAESLGLIPVFDFKVSDDEGDTWKSIDSGIIIGANSVGENVDKDVQMIMLNAEITKGQRFRLEVNCPSIFGGWSDDGTPIAEAGLLAGFSYNADNYGKPVWNATPIVLQGIQFVYMGKPLDPNPGPGPGPGPGSGPDPSGDGSPIVPIAAGIAIILAACGVLIITKKRKAK